MIQIEHVTKEYQAESGTVKAVNDVSLSIGKGEIYGIIGLSGAGKSTLVRCINYLERPTTGQVLIEGESLSDMSKLQLRMKRREISMIFQHFNLLMQKNVLDNVAFPLRIAGVKKVQAHEKAKELLGIVGLADKAKSYPGQLSGGQKQRVAIARALAADPKILLCDEATSALDPQTTKSILALLKEINEKFGITIVIITHEMAVVKEICTHVAMLENGQLIEEGTVEQVFNHPKTEAAHRMLSSFGLGIDNLSEVEGEGGDQEC